MTRLEMYKSRMEELGISAKKSLGQNFLISERVIEEIIRASLQNQPKYLIEVGPGLGALTEGLLAAKAQFTVIELDRTLAQYWRGRGLEVIEADALRYDWGQIPNVGDSVLVSNTPYQISSSLVIDRSLDEEPVRRMVLMFQKEVAERITAKEDSEAYGLLSVIAQTFWRPKLVVNAGSKDFFPPPKVTSRVLEFERVTSPVLDKEKYLKFVKAAFAQRRKTLVSNLKSQWSEEQIRKEIENLKHPLQVRAERLSVKDFIMLYKALKEG